MSDIAQNFYQEKDAICIKRTSLFQGILLSFSIFLTSNMPACSDTLYEAIRSSSENSSDIERQESRIRSAEEEVSIARSALNPDVFLEVGTGLYSRQESHSYAAVNNRNSGEYNYIQFSVSQTLLDGGRRQSRIDAAQAANSAETNRLEHLKQQVLMRAVKAFLNMQHDRKIIRHARENVKLMEQQTALELERFELGESTLTDLSQIRAYQRMIEIEHQEAKASLDLAHSNYRKYIGREADLKLKADFISDLLPKSLKQAIRIARQEHPILKVDDSLVQEAGYQLAYQSLEDLPIISVNGYFSKGRKPSEFHDDMAAIGLHLKIPLFHHQRVNGKVAQARERQFRRQLDRSDHMQEILENVTVIFKALAMARISSKTAMAAQREAQHSFQFAQEEREYGLISTPELLEIHKYMSETRRMKIGRDRAVRLAEFALLSAIGRLNSDWLPIHRKSLNETGVGKKSQMKAVGIGPAKKQAASVNLKTDHWFGLRKPNVVKTLSFTPFRNGLGKSRIDIHSR